VAETLAMFAQAVVGRVDVGELAVGGCLVRPGTAALAIGMKRAGQG